MSTYCVPKARAGPSKIVDVPPRNSAAAVVRGLALTARETTWTSTDTMRSLRGETSSMWYMSTRGPRAAVSWLKNTKVASPSLPRTHCQLWLQPEAKFAGASAGPLGAKAKQLGPDVGNTIAVFVGVGVTLGVAVTVGVMVMHAPPTHNAPYTGVDPGGHAALAGKPQKRGWPEEVIWQQSPAPNVGVGVGVIVGVDVNVAVGV